LLLCHKVRATKYKYKAQAPATPLAPALEYHNPAFVSKKRKDRTDGTDGTDGKVFAAFSPIRFTLSPIPKAKGLP